MLSYQKDRKSNYYYPYLEKKGTSYPGSLRNSTVILKYGTLIAIFDSPHSNLHAVQIMIDVNGPAGPNHYGHDTFFFFIENDSGGKIMGKRNYAPMSKCEYNSANFAYGCADWIIKNNNMDYLHK